MKFNLKGIMNQAWKFFHNRLGSFSECLKKAWSNAKAVLAAKLASGIKEEVKTWYGWKMAGREVIHESVAVLKVVVDDITTKSGKRTLSYFCESQTEAIPEAV